MLDPNIAFAMLQVPETTSGNHHVKVSEETWETAKSSLLV